MTAMLRFYPGDAIVLLAANVLAQVAVVVALAWGISAGFARHCAALRHAVWLGALGCTLVSPIVACLAARSGLSLVSLRVLPQTGSAETTVGRNMIPAVAAAEELPDARGDRLSSSGAGAIGSNSTDDRVPQTGLSAASRPQPHSLRMQERGSLTSPSRRTATSDSRPGDPLRALLVLFAAVWAAGVLFSLTRLSRGFRSIVRLRRRLRPVDDERLRPVLSDVCRSLDAATLPQLAACPSGIELVGPVTIGVFRPLVVLPERLLKTLGPSELRDVLTHEFAHALRHDPLVGCLQCFAAILYWPYPPVLFLNRKLAWAREELCDDYVLRQGDATSYAETLLAVSRSLSGGVQPAALGLFHPRGKLERRVAGLLDERRTIMVKVHRITMAALAGLFVAAIVLVAGTRLSNADPSEPPRLPTPPIQEYADPAKSAAVPADTPKASRIEPFDVLEIRAVGTLLDQPIDGFFLVEVDGRVGLGPSYGRANVKGLTPVEAEQRIAQQLKKILARTDVQVVMARKASPPPSPAILVPYRVQPLDVLQVRVASNGPLAKQPIDGFCLVEPDGRVPLGSSWGRVEVKGLTVDEAEGKIKQYLARLLPESPAVQVQWARRGEKWRVVVFPRVPYTISPGDWLSVRVLGTMLDRPIDGAFEVEPAGTVALGPVYGRAQVNGLTLEAAEEAIDKQLKQVLKKPTTQVTLPPFVHFGTSAQTPPGAGHWKEVPPPQAGYTIKPGDAIVIDAASPWAEQPITGFYLVEPAGTVALGPAYGRAQVTGLTLEGAQDAIYERVKAATDLWHNKPKTLPKVQVTLGGWEGVEQMVVGQRVRRAREAQTPRPIRHRLAAPPGGGTSKPSSSTPPQAPRETVNGVRPRGNCSISGRLVSAATGKPIANGTIYLFYLQTYGSIFLDTASDGTFVLKGIPKGPLSLRSTHVPGYQGVIYNPENKPAGAYPDFTLNDGENRTGLVLKAKEACCVSGKVLDEQGGVPNNVHTLRVLAWFKRDDGTGYEQQQTGVKAKDGCYLIDGLSDKPVYVMAIDWLAAGAGNALPPVYYPSTFSRNDAKLITFQKSRSIKGIDITLRKEGGLVLEGTVRDDTGKPVPEALVVTHRRDMLFDFVTAYTDNQGHYRLRGLGEGQFTVHVDAVHRGLVRTRAPIDLAKTNSKTRVNFTLTRGVLISGKFVDEKGGPWQIDASCGCANTAKEEPKDKQASKTKQELGKQWESQEYASFTLTGFGNKYGPRDSVQFSGASFSLGKGDYRECGQMLFPTKGTFLVQGLIPGHAVLDFSPQKEKQKVVKILHDGKDVTKSGFDTKPGQEIKDVTIVIGTR
jgi:protein involved in polysaccharide export with SLBB domain/beta-lactamase regulating signal transducer with metallopeptidase domain